MDVKGAYSKAPTDKEMYVPQPLGYVKIDENGTQLAGHLRKSLYGGADPALKLGGPFIYMTLMITVCLSY